MFLEIDQVIRLAVKLKDRLPNFFIIGVTKAGTTSLYEYIKRHREIYLSPVKETQFFCNDDLFAKGLEYYTNTFFKGAERYSVRGESSPQYIYFEKVAKRLAKLPQKESLKFILIMRDPVKRAYSLYWNMVYEGVEDLPFENAIEMEKIRHQYTDLERIGSIRFQYISSGFYARQIKKYLKYFSKDQFLFLFFEDLKNEPVKVFDRLFTFLGVEASAGITTNRVFNPAGKPRFQIIHRLIREPNWLKTQLGKLMPFSAKYKIVTTILRLNRKPVRYPALDGDLERRLRYVFKEDILELEEITNRNLKSWLPEK